jgi:hypothetical protein
MNGHATNILRIYMWLLGASLLLQGILSLILRIIQIPPPAFTLNAINADPLHATIHIVWGLVMLAFLVDARRSGPRAIALLGQSFGAFYIGLALLGVLIYHPFGLRLDLGENLFHFTCGPTTLALSIWAMNEVREPKPSLEIDN